MKLEIKKYPDKVLRKKCKKVKVFDEKLKKLAKDMLETLKASEGLGLAAPQVGESISLFVINIGKESFVFVNPKIIKAEGEEEIEEGCLSFPDLNLKIKRPKTIEVKTQNLEGKKETLRVKDLAARIFQHEIDHLNGILFIDYLPRQERIKIEKEFEKASVV